MQALLLTNNRIKQLPEGLLEGCTTLDTLNVRKGSLKAGLWEGMKFWCPPLGCTMLLCMMKL